MYLSIATKPQVGALFIKSEWGSAPEIYFDGTLNLTFVKSQIQDRGAKRGPPWTTPNLDGVKCRRSPCTTGGNNQFQLARNTIWVNADPGYQLKEPRRRCSGEGCRWSGSLRRHSCRVEAGNARAGCSVVEGSHRHSVRVEARQYQIVSIDRKEAKPVLVFEPESQFVLEVPTAATAVLTYELAGGDGGSLTPGKQSGDGRIVLLQENRTPDTIYYTYQLNQ